MYGILLARIEENGRQCHPLREGYPNEALMTVRVAFQILDSVAD